MVLCSCNEASYGFPGLWEIVFGFHMGAAVCQNKCLKSQHATVGMVTG